MKDCDINSYWLWTERQLMEEKQILLAKRKVYELKIDHKLSEVEAYSTLIKELLKAKRFEKIKYYSDFAQKLFEDIYSYRKETDDVQKRLAKVEPLLEEKCTRASTGS